MESLIGMPSAVSRRTVLKTAAGLGLSVAMPGLDLKAAKERGAKRPKSLIVLWMNGGPSQLETWDPHPGSKIGGQTKAITTKLPGLKIADMYPRVAEQIHHMSVVRSLLSKEGDHERGMYMVKTGFRPDPTLVHPSLGAILSFEKPDSKIEIPMHVSLAPGQQAGRGGYLGDSFDAFKIFDPGRNIQNLKSPAEKKRQDFRLKSLEVVSKTFRKRRRVQAENTLHQLTIERALRMMTSDQLRAFDIEKESESIRDAYGSDRFGRGCLVARRLVEEGVRSVEVTLNGWDTHANNHEGHIEQARKLDPPFAALIKDLVERDLFASTVVLCIGEFGRTPIINGLGGRDHWPTGFPCVLGGGGLKGGTVIGATDPIGKKKRPEDPIEIKDLYATVLHALGIEHDKEQITPIGRPMAYSYGSPIDRLLT